MKNSSINKLSTRIERDMSLAVANNRHMFHVNQEDEKIPDYE